MAAGASRRPAASGRGSALPDRRRGARPAPGACTRGHRPHRARWGQGSGRPARQPHRWRLRGTGPGRGCGQVGMQGGDCRLLLLPGGGGGYRDGADPARPYRQRPGTAHRPAADGARGRGRSVPAGHRPHRRLARPGRRLDSHGRAGQFSRRSAPAGAGLSLCSQPWLHGRAAYPGNGAPATGVARCSCARADRPRA